VAVRISAREVEKVDAREDDQEAHDQRYRVDGIGGVEASEQDEGSAQHGGGKGHVVDGADSSSLLAKTQLSVEWDSAHGLRERVQSFVEVIHLGHDAHYRNDSKGIGRRMRELVVAAKGQF
jgi:hypothetical protein